MGYEKALITAMKQEYLGKVLRYCLLTLQTAVAVDQYSTIAGGLRVHGPYDSFDPLNRQIVKLFTNSWAANLLALETQQRATRNIPFGQFLSPFRIIEEGVVLLYE